MSEQSLAEMVESLTPEEQDWVRRFIERLKQRGPSPYFQAADEFIAAHPELLRRLAQ